MAMFTIGISSKNPQEAQTFIDLQVELSLLEDQIATVLIEGGFNLNDLIAKKLFLQEHLDIGKSLIEKASISNIKETRND